MFKLKSLYLMDTCTKKKKKKKWNDFGNFIKISYLIKF